MSPSSRQRLLLLAASALLTAAPAFAGDDQTETAAQAEPVDEVEADRLAGERALRQGKAVAVPMGAASAAPEADADDADDEVKKSAEERKAERAEEADRSEKIDQAAASADERQARSTDSEADDEPFRVEVVGLSGKVLENVDAHLLSVPDDITVRGRYRTRVRQAIREGLRALGYYQATIKLAWKQDAKGARTRTLIAEVTPGEPVRLKAVHVEVKGEAKDDRAFKLLLKRLPKEGRRLDHGRYDTFKQQLQALALQRGYFDAKFDKSQLAVSPDLNQGFWNIEYDTGIRYRYGEVNFEGSQIEESYLRNLMPLKTGDYYDSEQVAELNRRLSQTGWFSSVLVAPDWEGSENASETHTLPITGVLVPATKNNVEAGVGFATDVGARLQTTWTRPWVNERGHSLKSTLNLSAYEQVIDAAYKIPEEANPLQEYWQIQAGLKRTNLNDTEANSLTFAGSRYWELESGWQRSVSLKWSYDDFTQGEETHKTQLIYPGVSLSRTRTKGGLMPRWGDSQRYTLDVSNKAWGSDIDFIAFNASGALIRTFALKHRFVLRGNFGWIETNDFDRVPPDLRFFAGGDRSVRGYDYKSISPEDSNGDLTGAARLLTGSVEYQFNVKGKWWGAVFVDAGEAVNDFKDFEVKKGAGLGVRWESPIGPVKVDVARPVGDAQHKSFAFYIGLGPEL